jgi:hypothetical protein
MSQLHSQLQGTLPVNTITKRMRSLQPSKGGKASDRSSGHGQNPSPAPATPSTKPNSASLSMKDRSALEISVGITIVVALILGGLLFAYWACRSNKWEGKNVGKSDDVSLSSSSISSLQKAQALAQTPGPTGARGRDNNDSDDDDSKAPRMTLTLPQGYDEETSTLGGDSYLFGSNGSFWDATTVANESRVSALTSGKDSTGTSHFEPSSNESIVWVDAPSGPLGLVLDRNEEENCMAFVAAVKESSILKDQVMVGDRLSGLDGDDVRSMTVASISELIHHKRSSSVRQFMLIRDK